MDYNFSHSVLLSITVSISLKNLLIREFLPSPFIHESWMFALVQLLRQTRRGTASRVISQQGVNLHDRVSERKGFVSQGYQGSDQTAFIMTMAGVGPGISIRQTSKVRHFSHDSWVSSLVSSLHIRFEMRSGFTQCTNCHAGSYVSWLV